jgi:hypothetical protein
VLVIVIMWNWLVLKQDGGTTQELKLEKLLFQDRVESRKLACHPYYCWSEYIRYSQFWRANRNCIEVCPVQMQRKKSMRGPDDMIFTIGDSVKIYYWKMPLKNHLPSKLFNDIDLNFKTLNSRVFSGRKCLSFLIYSSCRTSTLTMASERIKDYH